MELNGHPLNDECSNSTENKVVDKILQRSEERSVLLKKKKLEKNAEGSITEHTEYFNSVFNDIRQEIKWKLSESHAVDKELLSCYFDGIIKDLQKLQKLLSDSIMFMPAYEIKVAQESLKLLNEEIQETQNALLPKRKFTFRSKKKVNSAVCDSVDSVKHNGVSPILEPNASTVENLDNANIIKHNEDVDKKDVSLSLLTNCKINIFGAPSTLFISKLSNCEVFTGPVSTSVHIENCSNCTFVVACQQLRIHSTIMCALYTHVTSRTIVEDCSSLQFAPYSWTYCGQEEDFAASGLDRNQNNWELVDDFNWLVSSVPSPNWSILPKENRVVFS